MTEFIMMVGLPGSGKSTYADQLRKKGYHIHSSDAIREELTGDINSQDKNTDVFNILHKRVKEDLRNNISCVYDATNMSMKRRKAFLDEIKKYNCQKICMLFATPIYVCKGRNQKRKRKVPEEVFDKMLKSFWVPMMYEGWDSIKINIINGYKYDYPIALTINFDQCNPHHSLSLFEHMHKAGRYIVRYYNHNLNYHGTNLAWVALNHDIGKIMTQSFVNSKGEKTKEAHYYGHENVGAYLFLLNELYNRHSVIVADMLYMASLINWHMRPHTAWKQSEKSRERDRKLIGEKMYEDIMILNECDRAAH